MFRGSGSGGSTPAVGAASANSAAPAVGGGGVAATAAAAASGPGGVPDSAAAPCIGVDGNDSPEATCCVITPGATGVMTVGSSTTKPSNSNFACTASSPRSEDTGLTLDVSIPVGRHPIVLDDGVPDEVNHHLAVLRDLGFRVLNSRVRG